MDMKKSSMSSQNRLILVGFLACTTVIVLIAILATNAIQNNMNMAYKSFGQIIAKTLAIEIFLSKNCFFKKSPDIFCSKFSSGIIL